jgi:hypothetical protein
MMVHIVTARLERVNWTPRGSSQRSRVLNDAGFNIPRPLPVTSFPDHDYHALYDLTLSELHIKNVGKVTNDVDISESHSCSERSNAN